jgi:Nucleoside-diphosphate-sugar pyrophosphorylase involved in lipopolysaccharide biosynthesis/translation initiation factor 2B, gamma/epsilon subunits (eIF-2Bgamma/eIF-2Bepsilon)
VIMQADLTALLKTHTEGGYLGTMCVRQYSVSVPYGVVHTDGRHITGLVEKPSYTYFINAGVYCLRPEALDLFPRESFFNMTDFFTALVEKGHKASTYLLDGPWVDVGSVEDYNYACQNLKVLGMF